MNRKRKIRHLRKNIMKLGKITRIEVLKEDDGIIWPKKDWGYCVECVVNGYKITAPDDSWYQAYKGAYEAASWASEQEPFKEAQHDSD